MNYLNIFLTFLKIGVFSFGGGYSMIPLIEHEMVMNLQWLTEQEFLDILAITQVTPGPIAINSATFLGYKLGGFWGAAIATFAVILPSLMIMATLIWLYHKYKHLEIIDRILMGIRPIVIGLIAAAGGRIGLKVLCDPVSIILCVGAGIMIYSKKVHPIAILLLCGVIRVMI